jgi:hypothetical protein
MLNFYDWLETMSLGQLAVIDSSLRNDIDNELRENESFQKMDSVNFPRLQNVSGLDNFKKEKEAYIQDVNEANKVLNGVLSSLVNPYSDDIQETYVDYVLENMEALV